MANNGMNTDFERGARNVVYFFQVLWPRPFKPVMPIGYLSHRYTEKEIYRYFPGSGHREIMGRSLLELVINNPERKANLAFHSCAHQDEKGMFRCMTMPHTFAEPKEFTGSAQRPACKNFACS